jgi:uncharacterized protein (TIGR04255 family)
MQTEDELLLAQFRVDGFTLNRLRPYTSWDDLRPVALELWRVYLDAARPEALVRLALRYINEVALPSGTWEFSDYLRAAPSLPPEAPQDVAAFFSKVTAVEPDGQNKVHIGQKLRHAGAGPFYVLDIDAFRDGDWDPSDSSIPEVLDDLRRLKNLVFFSMLTERTLHLFE